MIVDCRDEPYVHDPDCIECDPDYQYAKFTRQRWPYMILVGFVIWALMFVGGYVFMAALVTSEISAVLAIFGIRL